MWETEAKADVVRTRIMQEGRSQCRDHFRIYLLCKGVSLQVKAVGKDSYLADFLQASQGIAQHDFLAQKVVHRQPEWFRQLAPLHVIAALLVFSVDGSPPI